MFDDTVESHCADNESASKEPMEQWASFTRQKPQEKNDAIMVDLFCRKTNQVTRRISDQSHPLIGSAELSTSNCAFFLFTDDGWKFMIFGSRRRKLPPPFVLFTALKIALRLPERSILCEYVESRRKTRVCRSTWGKTNDRVITISVWRLATRFSKLHASFSTVITSGGRKIA